MKNNPYDSLVVFLSSMLVFVVCCNITSKTQSGKLQLKNRKNSDRIKKKVQKEVEINGLCRRHLPQIHKVESQKIQQQNNKTKKKTQKYYSFG